MKTLIKFYFKAWGYFLFILALHKVCFMTYNASSFHNVSSVDLLSVFLYGGKLDLSSAGYLMMLPSIGLMIVGLFKTNIPRAIFRFYFLFVTILVTLIAIIDMKLYSYWHEKFDLYHLSYLSDSSQLFNSITFLDVLLPFLLFIGLCVLQFKLADKWLFTTKTTATKASLKSTLVFVVLGALSVIPIRGGFSLVPLVLGIPINVGAVYFHSQLALNHAAVTPFWNFLYSVTEGSNLLEKQDVMDSEVAEKLFQELNPSTANNSTISLLHTKQPNVILVILESFTTKAIGAYGADTRFTPNLNQLAKEGVLFKNFYANGNRSNRGIGSIFSSYPALSQTAIILYPEKIEKEPHLMATLKDEGYSTSFYYGGEIDFANMRAYFNQGKADRIVSKLNFPFKENNSKWGVHDHVVFDRMFEDINKDNEPFFSSIFTLSSHEPFDIPINGLLKDDEDEAPFINSIYYTDQSLRKFVEQCKQTSWWKNTLLIITADHGVSRIGSTANNAKETFHIPMLWLGGALNITGIEIDEYATQIDLAPTLLAQLGVDFPVKFGRNLFSPDYKPRAFYHSGDACTYLDTNYYITYNWKANVFENAEELDSLSSYPKAIFQVLTDDFIVK